MEVVLIYSDEGSLELTNYEWKFSGIKSEFAGHPILAWAEYDIYQIDWKINENFNEEWVEFLHKNVTK